MLLESVDNNSGESIASNAEWCLTETVSIHEVGEDQFAVRDLRTKAYFRVGPQEAFLLKELRGGIAYSQLKDRFLVQFGDALEYSDFKEFLELLAEKRLLKDARDLVDNSKSQLKRKPSSDDEDDEESVTGRGGSVLYYRLPLVNPNRMLNWFVKAFPIFWTKSFFMVTSIMMLFAFSVMIANAAELVVGFQNAIRWETLLIGIIAIVASTILHELGHGATCKRFGGEVTEAGFLFMFFIPCLYVNVSDAWILRERWKRLAITLAGGYCDLCIWAISVLVWRISETGSFVNYIAMVLLTTCGSRSLMNFNPLIRLDGYYLLSDILEYPNLYKQARQYWIGSLNWLLWGAKKPAAPRMPVFALGYGMVMWCFGLSLLGWVGWRLMGIARLEYGLFGAVFVGCLLYYGVRRVFRGFIGEELLMMITKRTRRLLLMVSLFIACCTACFWIPLEYISTGNFEVRPSSDVDVCSPVHSFIATVCVEDGQLVERDQTIVELHAPDLTAMLAAKDAELSNAKATLAKLEAGPRPEEIRTLENRAALLKDWCNLGATDLESSKKALEFELRSLSEKSNQINLQMELAETVLKKTEELKSKGAVAGSQILVEKSQLEVLKSQLTEVESKRSSVEAEGVNKSVGELAYRKRQLNDAESDLLLLRLGTRKEEIDAAKARVAMLSEELRFLEEQQSKLVVRSSTAGVVSAPRLREKVGQFAPKGMPICRIELVGNPVVELLIPETEAVRIAVGQKVRLKARSLPFETISATVERIAPAAAKPIDSANTTQSTLTRKSLAVHCSLDGSENRLKSGMTGVGRVSCGKKNLAEVSLTRFYQYIRTEFWW